MSHIAVRRTIAFAAGSLFLLVAAVLLLADRSGSIVGNLRPVVIDAGRQIESLFDVDVIDHDDIPGTADQLGHAALWGTGMALFGWLGRYRLPIPLTALLIASTSLVFEALQPVVSATRAFEPSDAVGNMAGIALVAVMLGPVVWVERRLSVERITAQRA